MNDIIKFLGGESMDDKLFELVEKMYSDLKNEISSVKNDLTNEISLVKKDLSNEIRTVGNQVLKLENDINPKIEALFDGYKQNTETLERIEKEVSKQEEIIMQRVK